MKLTDFRIGMFVQEPGEHHPSIVQYVRPFSLLVAPVGSSVCTEYHSDKDGITQERKIRSIEEIELVDHPANVGFLLRKLMKTHSWVHMAPSPTSNKKLIQYSVKGLDILVESGDTYFSILQRICYG